MVSMLWLQAQNKATQFKIQSEIEIKKRNREIQTTSIIEISVATFRHIIGKSLKCFRKFTRKSIQQQFDPCEIRTQRFL